MLYRMGWNKNTKDKESIFYDPMCGSGTIALEAALMAHNIAPGLLRESWAIKHLLIFDDVLWDKTIDMLHNDIADFNGKIYATDASDKMVESALANLSNIPFSLHNIHINHSDMLSFSLNDHSAGIMIANPPYGERLMGEKKDELLNMFHAWGKHLYKHYQQWDIGILTNNFESISRLQLKSTRKNKFYNGALETYLFRYSIDKNSYIDEESPTDKLQRKSQLAAKINFHHEALSARLRKNAKQLKSWLRQQNIHAYRIYDADLPDFSCAVDIYDNFAIVQEYQAGSTISEEGAEMRLYQLIYQVHMTLNIAYKDIFLKTRYRQKGKLQYQKEKVEPIYYSISENNAKFWVNFDSYIDTGLFLDHRKMRKLVAEYAQEKTLLNLFSYTCSVGVLAALHGARKTTNIDMSATYLNWGKRNYALNNISIENHEFIQEDLLCLVEEK